MKWDLTYLFKTHQDFEVSLNELNTFIPRLASYQGKLHNENDFVQYLNLSDEFESNLLKVYQYAHLKSDLNKKDVPSASDLQKVHILLHHASQALSFESPELLSIGKETLMKYIDIPVSHFTGLPQINIPLYTITEGSLKIPISLSYRGGGN